MSLSRLLHIFMYLMFAAVPMLGKPALSAPGLSSMRSAGILAVDDAFHLSVSVGENGSLILNWVIAPGHYLYRDRIVAKDQDRTLALQSEEGELKDDPTFGPTQVYHRAASAVLPAGSLPEGGTFELTYQGCLENVLCYPPVTKVVDVQTLTTRHAEPGGAAQDKLPASAAASSSTRAEAGTADELISLEGGLVPMLAGFFGLGLLLSLTPCVFPMIPILSGMLANAGGPLSLARSFALSGTYVVAMALAYSALGIVAAWSGANLQVALQTPVAILLISAVFVALALSMFGLYELQLPQSLISRFVGRASGRGSIGGAAAMGFGSALIVGPCVTPPLAAALLYVMQSGSVLRGSTALFFFGLGTGVPLLLFGTFGAKALPRSGAWLVRTKHAFGFVFVALSIWMLGRIVPSPVTAAGWGGLSIALGLYLLWAFRSQTGRRPFRFVACGIGIACLSYGVVVAVSAALGSYEALRPLAAAGIFVNNADPVAAHSDFQVVSTNGAFDDALRAAKAEQRSVLIDFSAEWCTECKIMERTVFPQEHVRKELSRMALIRADVTQQGGFSTAIMKRFSIVGPPSIVFLNPQGFEQVDARLVGAVDAPTLLHKVTDVLDSHEVEK